MIRKLGDPTARRKGSKEEKEFDPSRQFVKAKTVNHCLEDVVDVMETEVSKTGQIQASRSLLPMP